MPKNALPANGEAMPVLNRRAALIGALTSSAALAVPVASLAAAAPEKAQAIDPKLIREGVRSFPPDVRVDFLVTELATALHQRFGGGYRVALCGGDRIVVAVPDDRVDYAYVAYQD